MHLWMWRLGRYEVEQLAASVVVSEHLIHSLSICLFIFQVLIIEVNTVPGMTPSTVLIHQVLIQLSLLSTLPSLFFFHSTSSLLSIVCCQALEEHPPLYPQRFFRTLLDFSSSSSEENEDEERWCEFADVFRILIINMSVLKGKFYFSKFEL